MEPFRGEVHLLLGRILVERVLCPFGGRGQQERERERDRASTSWRVGDPLGRFLVKTFGTIGGFLFSTSRFPFDQRKFACLLGGSSLVNAF